MRFVYYVLIIVASVTLPWWLVLPLWAYYAFMCGTYELIPLGIALDAYFGIVFPWHMLYTLSAVLLCFCVEVLKPRLTFSIK